MLMSGGTCLTGLLMLLARINGKQAIGPTNALPKE